MSLADEIRWRQAQGDQGGGASGAESSGIHWHVDPGMEIRYRSDETREEIYEVEYTNADGELTHYADRRAPEEGGIWRTMDCVDCHNRPSHIYKPAASEIDRVINEGLIDRSLPFVKREGLRIIDAEYPSHEEARAAISAERERETAGCDPSGNRSPNACREIPRNDARSPPQ